MGSQYVALVMSLFQAQSHQHFSPLVSFNCILQTPWMVLPFYKNRLSWKGKTVTEAFTTLPLKIFLTSHAVAAVSAKISVERGFQGNERKLHMLWEVLSFLHTAFSCGLKSLPTLCIFPYWSEMLLISPQLHSHTLFLCSSFKKAKTYVQLPDSLHTLWLEILCHSCLLQTLKPVYLLYINLPVFFDILFFSLFLQWDEMLISWPSASDLCGSLIRVFQVQLYHREVSKAT